MTDKEFQRLNRSQLIDIIYELQLEQKKLNEEKEELQKQLDEQRIEIQKAGSIAEAAMGLTNIFEIAQKTADKYLEEVYKSNTNEDEIIADARIKAEQMIKEAKEESERIKKEAFEDIENKRKLFQERVENVLESYSMLEKYLEEKEKMK